MIRIVRMYPLIVQGVDATMNDTDVHKHHQVARGRSCASPHGASKHLNDRLIEFLNTCNGRHVGWAFFEFGVEQRHQG